MRAPVEPEAVVRTGSVMLSLEQSLQRQPKPPRQGSRYPGKCQEVVELHRLRKEASFTLTRDLESVEAARESEAVTTDRSPYPPRLFGPKGGSSSSSSSCSQGGGGGSRVSTAELKRGVRTPGIPTAITRNISGLLATAPSPHPPRDVLDEHFGTGPKWAGSHLADGDISEEDLLCDTRRLTAQRSDDGVGGSGGDGRSLDASGQLTSSNPDQAAAAAGSRPASRADSSRGSEIHVGHRPGSRSSDSRPGSRAESNRPNSGPGSRPRSRQQPAVPSVGYETAFSEFVTSEGPARPKTPGKGLPLSTSTSHRGSMLGSENEQGDGFAEWFLTGDLGTSLPGAERGTDLAYPP